MACPPGLLLEVVKIAGADAIPEPAAYDLFCIVGNNEIVFQVPFQLLVFHLKRPKRQFPFVVFSQNTLYKGVRHRHVNAVLIVLIADRLYGLTEVKDRTSQHVSFKDIVLVVQVSNSLLKFDPLVTVQPLSLGRHVRQ